MAWMVMQLMHHTVWRHCLRCLVMVFAHIGLHRIAADSPIRCACHSLVHSCHSVVLAQEIQTKSMEIDMHLACQTAHGSHDMTWNETTYLQPLLIYAIHSLQSQNSHTSGIQVHNLASTHRGTAYIVLHLTAVLAT